MNNENARFNADVMESLQVPKVDYCSDTNEIGKLEE